MTAAYASVNGIPADTLRLHVGNTGPWYAVADLTSTEALSGAVTIRLGDMTLTGTIVERFSGVEATDRWCKIVGGAGAWATVVRARGYHSDAGVKAKLVAEDVAREVGETLGSFVPARTTVGVDYARETTLAVAVLEDVAGPGVAWWVDYAGVTHVGTRPAATADAGGYDVLSYDPRARLAELAITDPAAITIGSLITREVDAPRVVREIDITASGDGLHCMVWFGQSDVSGDRLTSLVRNIVDRATDSQLLAAYRYRVVRMSSGRAELQPVNPAAGLPDLTGIEVWPGVASAHAELTAGSHVLVQFIDGARSQPFVSHVSPRGGVGWVPASVVIGGDTGAPCARQGDAVDVYFPSPMQFNGFIGVAPATGVLTFPAVKTVGVISSGSTKVKVAT